MNLQYKCLVIVLALTLIYISGDYIYFDDILIGMTTAVMIIVSRICYDSVFMILIVEYCIALKVPFLYLSVITALSTEIM